MTSVIVVLKGLVEFAGLLLIAQGVVRAISFGRHEQNPIYLALRFLTRPVVQAVRSITPAVIIDRHVPAVALFLLFCCWVGLILLKAWQLGAVG